MAADLNKRFGDIADLIKQKGKKPKALRGAVNVWAGTDLNPFPIDTAHLGNVKMSECKDIFMYVLSVLDHVIREWRKSDPLILLDFFEVLVRDRADGLLSAGETYNLLTSMIAIGAVRPINLTCVPTSYRGFEGKAISFEYGFDDMHAEAEQLMRTNVSAFPIGYDNNPKRRKDAIGKEKSTMWRMGYEFTYIYMDIHAMRNIAAAMGCDQFGAQGSIGCNSTSCKSAYGRFSVELANGYSTNSNYRLWLAPGFKPPRCEEDMEEQKEKFKTEWQQCIPPRIVANSNDSGYTIGRYFKDTAKAAVVSYAKKGQQDADQVAFSRLRRTKFAEQIPCGVGALSFKLKSKVIDDGTTIQFIAVTLHSFLCTRVTESFNRPDDKSSRFYAKARDEKKQAAPPTKPK